VSVEAMVATGTSKIFLCHASEDKPAVRKVHAKLVALGYEPWLDEHDLIPGQDFKREISSTLRECKCVFIFFSNNSVSKRGFVQREMNIAIDVLQEIPLGGIFIIPIRLDDCEIPQEFEKLQWVDFREKSFWSKLQKSLKAIYSVEADYDATSFFDVLNRRDNEWREENLQRQMAAAEAYTKKKSPR
jgi:hypothetical protein